MCRIRRSRSPPNPPVASSVDSARIVRRSPAAVVTSAPQTRPLQEEPLGHRTHQELASLTDDALAGEDEVRHVGLAATAVAENRDRIGQVDTQGPHPAQRVSVTLDDTSGQSRIGARIDIVHVVAGAELGGPDEACVCSRTADCRALLDGTTEAPRVLRRPSSGTQSRHPAAKDEQVHLVRAVVAHHRPSPSLIVT